MDDNKKKGQKAHSDDKPSAGQDSRRDFVRKALTASGFIVAAGAINSGLVPKAYAQVTTTTTTTTTTVQPTTTGSPTTTGGPTTTAPPPTTTAAPLPVPAIGAVGITGLATGLALAAAIADKKRNDKDEA
ncbi:hypothetical protein GCM10007052_23220 [Halioglobus japonicus]|uniref:Twin-arginine translocation signal domain-containing protein n=1 Tax=Halioglobus japonicus TaxID=930805 RepID=A0AAP8SMN3_9GAMM|nr:hypothetical protein [Halioglobus japonicus]PLW85709.1 hypothetical protein C0029_13985 [Halioglobus japonicus]GHD17093.1 hypothetical protein GCM10007052_23220 [Halioglobus japonicus]